MDRPMNRVRPALLKGGKRGQTINVGGLFKRQKFTHHGGDGNLAVDVTAKGSERVFAPYVNAGEPKKHNAAPYLRYREPETVGESAAASEHEHLQAGRDAPITCLNSYDINGTTVPIPGVPTQADIDSLELEEEALFASLEDEVIEVQIPQAEGSFRRKQFSLGQTINTFTQRCEDKSRELEALRKELEQVNADIIVAMEELAKAKEGPIKRAREKLEAEIAGLGRKLAKAKEDISADCARASQGDDEEAETEWDRKVRQFMKTIT